MYDTRVDIIRRAVKSKLGQYDTEIFTADELLIVANTDEVTLKQIQNSVNEVSASIDKTIDDFSTAIAKSTDEPSKEVPP